MGTVDGTDSDVSDAIGEVTHLFAQTNLHRVPASRFDEMTPAERGAALQDLHGALDLVKETPELMALKLHELDWVISDIVEGRAAFDEARSANAQHVHDMKECFLRSNSFDVQKAASRMMTYYTTLLLCFQNREVLSRDLRLSDLSLQDRTLFQEGFFQLLSEKDRVGRPIVMIYPGSEIRQPVTFMRLLFLTNQLARMNKVDQISDQQNGMVIVWYGVGTEFDESKESSMKHAPALLDATQALPLKPNSLHLCFDNMDMVRFWNEIGEQSTLDGVFRLRTHYGSNIACQSSLQTYGIPADIIPINAQGVLDLRYQQLCISRLEQLEQPRTAAGAAVSSSSSSYLSSSASSVSSSASSYSGSPYWPSPKTLPSLQSPSSSPSPSPSPCIIDTPPTEMDIILGRGQRGKHNPANRLLTKLLKEQIMEYYASSRIEKARISHTIYTTMKKAGCRFLAPVEPKNVPIRSIGKTAANRSYKPSSWIEVDESEAKSRISHRFRNMKR